MEVAGIVLSTCGGSVDYTKLIKILYLIDRQSLFEKGRQVTEDDYLCIKQGVVLKGVYDLIKNRFCDRVAQDEWNSFFNVTDHNISLKENMPNWGELSRYEEKVVRDNAEKYKGFSKDELVSLHYEKCPEWKDVKGESVPLEKKAIMKALGFSRKEIRISEKEDKIYRKEKRVFARLAAERGRATRF